MSAHALLSASGASRWIACTPSARLEAQFPNTTSPSAEEGTFAHEFAEMKLKSFYNMISEDQYQNYLHNIQENTFWTTDLEEYVDEYVNTIIEKYEHAKALDLDAQLILEQRLDFSKWVPNGFGRGDAIIISNGILEICDLKYGRNIPVLAANNPQLRLYALGAYEDLNFIYDISNIQITVIQPRNQEGGGSEKLTIKELLGWGESIKHIAEIAYKGEGDLKAGTHCQFCRAAARCRALAEYNLSLEKHDFKNPNLLTDMELSDVLDKIDNLTKWANKVKEYCLKEALEGHKFEGYKLVEGRSISKYSDEAKVEKKLRDNGYGDEILKPKELLGSTALKKLISTKRFNELVGPLMIKPQGKPVLVPIDDVRAEFNSARDDFEVIQ